MDNFQSPPCSEAIDDSEQNNYSSNDEVCFPLEMIELDERSDLFNIQIENIGLLVNSVIENSSFDFQQDIFQESGQVQEAIQNNDSFPTFNTSAANTTLDLASDSSTTLLQQINPLEVSPLTPLISSQPHTSKDREEIGQYLSKVSAPTFDSERDDSDSNIIKSNLLEHIETITSSSYEQNDVLSRTSLCLLGITSQSEERSELRNSYELHVSVYNAEVIPGPSGMNAKAQYRRKGGSFVSAECKKEFLEKSSHEKHYRTHTEEKHFPCDNCGERFTGKGDFDKHNQTHTGERSYSCEMCEKRFNYKSHLERHQRIHTGERPYPCEMCEKRFNTKSNLKTHQRTHTRERPYSCEMCEKRFSSKSVLKVHQRTHTGERPYPCEKCEKRFNSKCVLKVHQRTHTGERPYLCEMCEKRYINKSNLMNHLQVHSREQRYTCSICYRAFTTNSEIRIHYKNVHNKKNKLYSSSL